VGDPLRMYLVLRRGAIATLARGGELAGASAVACLRAFGEDPEHREAIAAWRDRPGKVCLRARTNAQWEQVLAEPPARADPADEREALTYALNPAATMSSGKTLAQIAHAAVMADETGAVDDWVAAGCPSRVVAPDAATFAALAAREDCVARVVDAGLTEIAPGTVTVIALGPAPAAALAPELRAGGEDGRERLRGL
jgi:peptidyl-tRNA hydrolase